MAKNSHRKGITLEEEYGIKLAKAIRKKLSKSHKGHYPSKETKIKMRISALGKNTWSKNRPLSKKHKEHISNGLKGHISWNKGLTKETDERMRKIGDANKGHIPWSKGLTKETDQRIRRLGEANKKRTPWNKGKTGVYSQKILKKMLQRRIPTSLEEQFQKIVDKYNLPYKYVGDGSFIIGRYNPDFINTNSDKIAIEVYARYYKLRNSISIEEWKKERAKVFAKYGWKIIYFDETQVKEDYILLALRGIKCSI